MSNEPAPWLPHYDPGVPATLAPYPSRTLARLPRRRRAQTSRRPPALLFKGATLTYGELERAERRLRVGVRGARRHAGRPRRRCCCPTARSSSSPSSRAWKIGAIVAPLNPTYTEHELEGADSRARHRDDRHADALLRAREERAAAHAAQARHRHQHQGILSAAAARAVHAVRARSATAIASRLRPAITTSRTCCSSTRGRKPTATPAAPDDPAVLLMSGGTTGTPKGAARHARRVRVRRPADPGMDRSRRCAAGDVHCLLPLPLFHVYANVGVQALALVNGNPLALVPNPRDLDDLVATIRRVKPAFFNGVPTLYIATAESSGRRSGQGRLQVDQDLLLRRVRAAGGHEAALRSAHRRPHRRRLFADRSDDGAVRQPGGRPQQARLGRHAAARRARAHLRRRRRDATDAGGRGRRDRDRRAAADGRLLEPAGRDAPRPARARRTRARHAAGCTRAISAISTTTATCSSSIARRT